MRNAINEFGFAPRDVYNGVFQLVDTKEEHAEATEQLRRSDLQSLVNAFHMECRFDGISDRVLAVHPVPGSYDSWIIYFKSPRIAKKAVELMRSKGDELPQDMCCSFGAPSEAATLAGWISEANVLHREFLQK